MQGETTIFTSGNASEIDLLDTLAACERLTEAVRMMAADLGDELAKDAIREVCDTLHRHLEAATAQACADNANAVLAEVLGQAEGDEGSDDESVIDQIDSLNEVKYDLNVACAALQTISADDGAVLMGCTWSINRAAGRIADISDRLLAINAQSKGGAA